LFNRIDKILLLIDDLKQEAIFLEHINVGGGLGVCYQNSSTYNNLNNLELIPTIQEYVNLLLHKLIPTNLKIYID
jgi:diaminopimelate decarboxylase